MVLSPEQLLIVSLVASTLTVLFRFFASYFGFQPGKATLTVVVAVVSFMLAVVFNLPELPVYIDPLQYLAEVIAIVSAYVGMATLIYNVVFDKVLDALNWTAERFYRPR